MTTYFQNHSQSNVRIQKHKQVEPERQVNRYTLFDCPMLQLQILILEDRVQYNVMNLVNNIIPKSTFADDPKIKELCKSLYCNKANPAKRGMIGKYNHELSQNLTYDEQCAFADCVEAYDKAVVFPERIMKARIKEYAATKIDNNVELLADICLCAISANCARMYHDDVLEKIPNTDMYLRNMKWDGNRMKVIESILDNIASHVAGYVPIDFTKYDPYNKSYEVFISTICKDSRLKEHYQKIGNERDKILTDPQNNINLLDNNIFNSNINQ